MTMIRRVEEYGGEGEMHTHAVKGIIDACELRLRRGYPD